MRVVLITTSYNAVRETLERLSDSVEVHVIDCINYNNGTIAEIRKNIISELGQYYLEKGAPDILLTYRCPCLIPKCLYSQVSLGAFNIHPSLLPKYRGLNPWEKIFRQKESVNGVTLHALSEKPDSGDIILQEKYCINPDETMASARKKADDIAGKMIHTSIEIWIRS